MATFTAGTSFTDGVTGDVTASKLNALVANATPLANLITDRTAETSIATDDLVLISDTSETGALNKMTVANLMKAEMTGTINSTAGTIQTLTSSTATITGGTFGGSINSTAGTIGTLNSTNGVIPTLTSTTLVTSGTGTAAAPAIVPTGDTNTGIFFPAADTVGISTGGTERVRVDSSGNVGVKNTAPSTTFSAVGGYGIAVGDGTGSPSIALYGANNAGQGIYFGDSNTGTAAYSGYVDYLHQSDALRLGTASTERLRITSGGEVCVGITSSGAKFHVYNSGSTDARVAYFEKASGTTDGYYLVCYAGVTTHFQVLGSGNCQNVNNSYGAISDEKIKQDIVDASTQWNDIKNLRVRKFRFKSDPSMPLQIGLVAQEVELVSPHLVEEVKDTDMDGADLGTTTKGVKYSVLYMKAVKALQEAMERIETLETNNTALESRIAALEAA